MHKLNFAELSRATKDAGNYIPVIGLRRIEDGQRRVTVDDLTVFARIFQVTLGQLLLPEDATVGIHVTGFDEPMTREDVNTRLGLFEPLVVLASVDAARETVLQWVKLFKIGDHGEITETEPLEGFAERVAKELEDGDR